MREADLNWRDELDRRAELKRAADLKGMDLITTSPLRWMWETELNWSVGVEQRVRLNSRGWI